VEEKSSPDLAAADARVPEIFEGVQGNHCRRPTCRNFGVDPVNGASPGGGNRTADANYTLADVSSSTLYGKIDFLHRQVQMFAAAREATLFTKPFRRLYLSTDRQDYLVNWKKRDNSRSSSRRSIASSASATACANGCSSWRAPAG
jgi:hypothetical protein